MANIIPLTAKLQAFKDTVSPSISSMENTKNEIANYLNEATTTYESAYNGITSSITDDQGKAAAQSLALVKQAVEIMKNSITNDMGNILSECSKISDEIARIESEIERGNKLTPGWWEKVWNDIVGFFTSKWCENDAGEIKRINEEVGQSMNALEAQLDAIASSSNSIRLGIIGNMVAGGTLGSYIDFASSYNFNLQQWKAENPIYHANVFGKTACFVVGQVEGVFKFFEGAVDAVLVTGAAVTQGVGCIFGQDWSQNIFSEMAKFDIAGSITGLAYDSLKSIGQYDENYRTAGNFVGEVVSAIALSTVLTPAGALYFMTASSGGQAGETSLQAGNTSAKAFGQGTIVGGVTLLAGGALSKLISTPQVQNVVSKVGNWLSSGSVPANVVKNVSNFVGKTANIATKPAQLVSKGMITTGKAVGTRVASSVSTIENKISNNKIAQGVKNLHNKLSQNVASSTIQSTDGIQTKIDQITGVSRVPASANGAPSSVTDSALAQVDDATFNAYQQANGVTPTQIRINDVTGVSRVPASANGAPSSVADSALAQVDDATFNAYQLGTQSRIDSVTGVSRVPASANGAPSSVADSALAQVDDATFNAYQQANGLIPQTSMPSNTNSKIVPTILGSANVIRNNNDN